MRRWSGGRAMAWGEGFVGISLVLPHRSALVSTNPDALAPAQVMNRCVRGILAACEDAGVPAFYPGRDLLTVERRLLGMVSFAVEGGALVFEAVLANGGDASVLPRLLDRADPRGVVASAMLTAADTTSLAARLGHPLALADLAARIARGYEERLGVRCVTADAPTPAPFDEPAWLDQRRRRDDLERSFSIASQLGVIEVRFARDDERVLDIAVGGDLIAPAATIDRLEAALRGCPVARDPLRAAIGTVLSEPAHFVLGVGTPDEFADAIAGGIAA